MFKPAHILAVVDFRQSEHFALPRAIDLAHQFNSKVTVVSNTYESFMDFIPSSSAIDKELIKAEALKHNKEGLKELVNKIDVKNIDLNYEILWSKNYHNSLSELINNRDFDLVVKTTRNHSALEKILFTPTDWHLLRDTQTNILFVKKDNWPAKTSVLGAININDDEKHRELNKKIILTTVELSEANQSKANILNVFPWPMVKFDKFNHLFDGKDLFLEIKNKHSNAVNRFVNNVSKISGKIIIAEGLEPEETIPKMVKSSHSNLLVIGTVGRKGIKAVMLGNTAEKILDEIECEVLVVK